MLHVTCYIVCNFMDKENKLFLLEMYYPTAKTAQLIDARAEDRGADAYHRTAALDGYQIVVAHAPGTLTEPGGISKIGGLYLVEEVGGLGELTAYLLVVVGEGGHHHQSADAHMNHGVGSPDHF